MADSYVLPVFVRPDVFNALKEIEFLRGATPSEMCESAITAFIINRKGAIQNRVMTRYTKQDGVPYNRKHMQLICINIERETYGFIKAHAYNNELQFLRLFDALMREMLFSQDLKEPLICRAAGPALVLPERERPNRHTIYVSPAVRHQLNAVAKHFEVTAPTISAAALLRLCHLPLPLRQEVIQTFGSETTSAGYTPCKATNRRQIAVPSDVHAQLSGLAIAEGFARATVSQIGLLSFFELTEEEQFDAIVAIQTRQNQTVEGRFPVQAYRELALHAAKEGVTVDSLIEALAASLV
nr:hypothetical protein [uncultured Halomonas sp.]